MSNLTQITDKLFALSIPINADRFYFSNTVTKFICFNVGLKSKSIPLNVSTLDKYEILGTVDLESISFDCSEYTNATGLMAEYWFRNLLKSKGIEPTSESKVLIIEKV